MASGFWNIGKIPDLRRRILYTAALLAVLVPKLSALCGRLFDQPSAASTFDPWQVLWAALLLPPVLLAARLLPPFRAFTVPAERVPGVRA